MAAVKHVGVIGAGLAGLAAALAAVQAGMRVDLFEARSAPSAVLAHIDVVPNLLRDLVALGIGDACVRCGFQYRGLEVVDAEARTRFEIPTPRLAGVRYPPSLGMVYGDLLQLLRDAGLAHGARLHLGTPVLDAWDKGAIVTADGERHRVDLSLIATGPTLPAVAATAPRATALASLPQQWCYALLPRPVALERTTWVIGHGTTKALVVPVDMRRAGIAVLQPEGASQAPAALRQTLAAQGPLLRSLGALCGDDMPTQLRAVHSGVLDGEWHAHGALRIGHSAHVLPPHFGQAAAQTLEDAVVLGDLLRARPQRNALLQAFMARRGKRARRVHALVAQAARWDVQPDATTDLRALAGELARIVAEPA